MLMEGDVGDDFYDAKVKTAALGEKMDSRKAELKKSFRSTGIPQPETRTMTGANVLVGHPV